MSRKSSKKTKSKFIYRWTVSPNLLLGHPTLKATDKIVWLILASHLNPISKLCCPKVSTIARESRLSENTVKRSRKRLKKVGLLDWRLDKKERNSSQYELPLLSGSIEEQKQVIANIARYLKETFPRYQKETLKVSKRDLEGIKKRPCPNGAKAEQSKDRQQFLDKELLQGTRSKNNNKLEVVSSLSLKSQKQRTFFQKIWSEWSISLSRLTEYKLLEVLLWTEYIKRRIGEGYKVSSPSGYLFNSLKDKKREVPDREEKIQGLLDKFIPTVRIYEIPSAPKDKKQDTDFRYDFTIEAQELEQQEKDIRRLEEELKMSITEIAQKAKKDEKVKKRMLHYLYEDAVWTQYFEQGWFEKWREEKEKVEKLREEPMQFFEKIKEEFLRV